MENNHAMTKQLRHIALTLTLLLMGGMANEVWAKVTYHILSLPMTTHQRNGTNNLEGDDVNVFRTNVRVEVLRCVSPTLTVGLPFEYKSPLVTTYHYYASDNITRSSDPEQLYGYNNTKYYLYTINGSSSNEDVSANQLTAGDACEDNIDIYVTYDYDPATSSMDLGTDLLDPNSGSHTIYNIHLKDRMVALNQKRQNRPGAVLDGQYTAEQLASNDFEWITSAGIGNGDGYRHFAFKFGGNDPYNVTIFTAFDKPYTYRGTGRANFYTEFKKDRDKYTQKDVYKEYRGASFFSLMGSEITSNMWLSSEAHTQWLQTGTADAAVGKTVPGFFKGPNDNKSTLYEMSPIFNSFAILNHKSGEGWALAGSKMNHGTQNWQPKASNGQIQYMDYKDNGNNITIVYKADASACKVDVYEIKEYVFRVQTPFGSNVDATMKWSEYSKGETITESMVPDALKRKYVNFTGSFYADAAHNTAITTFEGAQASCSKDASDRPVIYVGYEVSGTPFTAITAANKTSGYTTATWYEMTDAASDGGKKIKWDATNSVYKNNGESTVYEKESEFAFIGDPYELRIINRALTAANSRNFYVGSSLQQTGTDLTNFDSGSGTETAGFKWEIPYDETIGSFTLREFDSTDAYWQWNTSEGNNIQYSTSSSTRIKLMEIGKVNYTFKVVDLAGNIAIQATAELTPFTTLTGYANIPAAIRSPFLSDETVKFYSTYGGSGRGNLSGSLTELPGTASDIYVAYTTANLSSKNIKLLYNEQFNVKLNGEYIYWNSSDNKILSNASPTTAELESGAYLWHLRGRDPYSMRIDNVGYSATLGSPLPDIKALTWTSDRDQASRFIAMMSNNVGVYEVLAATGTSDYYRIGRASTTGAETRIYANATYAHGADQLRFELAGTETIYYHLIDKSGNEIFTDEITSKNPRLTLPSEYVSPLVEEYYYYPTRAKAASDSSGDRITEITADTNESGGARDDHVYVTYKVSDFGFGTSYPRLLKFLNPLEEGYYLEDGSDKLITGKLQAIYPYCNGDGNLNIYGEKMRDEQMNGGSSTRPRWKWYFESATSDPYHVTIHSHSTISFNGTHSTYFQTQAIHFNQDANANLKHIVTGANFPGISGQAATEYMILGTTGRYKLVTTAKIAADLNGDGDTDDDGENERRTVTSFEQYWKTYNMLKQYVLEIDYDDEDDPYHDEYSDDAATFVIPDALRETLKTKLDAKGIGGSNWHSYDAIANATRWNGYNNVEGSSGYQKKVVERLEHWFQTFDMGDGAFDIEDANIPPVLVLLDRHGWEIMRKPLPTSSSDPDRDAKLAALRAYDSPMVKEYKFYNNANKASGCHKYSLRMQNGAERDPIKLNGKQYTSTSLADLPPLTASGVVSSGAINDQFVTFTVKEEYEKSYDPSTATASKFIVLQNGTYAKANGTSIAGTAVQTGGVSAMILAPDATADSDSPQDGVIDDVNLWYVQPNSAIDTEMGYPTTLPTYTDAENGFDPYNVQLKNASTSKFFTIDMTKSVLDGGHYNGDYTGGSLDVTLADACTAPVASPESHDHSTLHMTNQTFMAVQDENGNMQLMPRFDHNRRINAFTTLADPLTNATTASVDDASPGAQTTFLIRPLVFDYRIIDNDGLVAMHYRTAGEFYPSMPEHFKSPLAKDFEFYKGLTATAGVYDLSGITESNKITSSFAAADIQSSSDIFIRYSYDDEYDKDNDNILQGRWMTMTLGGNDAQASGTLAVDGTGVGIYKDAEPATKPATIDSDDGQWQWKFLQSPCAETSLYYKAPDPYAVGIFNRAANYDDPLAANSKMAIPIKVSGTDRFVLLAHPDGGYALAAASDNDAAYSFLNGGSMTAPSTTAASVETEAGFTTASKTVSTAAQVLFANEVTHTYRYHIITNGGLLAASQDQSQITAFANHYVPVVPEDIQSPLINDDDYLYYGNATPSAGIYTPDVNSVIDNLYGLYDDVVYVRYPAFDRDNTPYMVPNIRNSTSPVAVGSGSNDVAIDLSGNLPYNIFWLSDNMMQSTDGSTISDGGDNAHELSAASTAVWHFEGSDPYAIQIKRDGTANYVDGTTVLNATAKNFMLLKRDGYDFGVLAETGNQDTMLSGYGQTTVTDDHNPETTADNPTKFIIFALSVHKLIYHLVIAKSCPDRTNPQSGEYVDIPYRTGDENTYTASDTWSPSQVERIYGTTQRDLTSTTTVTGDTYQLGVTLNGQTYSHDAGQVSLGDELETPACFYRPNCTYLYYIEGVYDGAACEVPNVALTNRFKGLKITKLMSDAGLIGKTVKVNIAYHFLTGLDTNAGEGFVTSTGQNLWYTFETSGSTPRLAEYTESLQTVSGYATHYTNDYLWTPLGDPYGFKMYNRYMHKNLGETTTVMTTTAIADNQAIEMRPDNEANSVYELLADESTTAGYFMVHPVVNNTGTQYYMRDDNGTMKLSTTHTEWTYGLSEDVMRPYYEGAGNVGGLNAAGKAAYEAAAAKTDDFEKLVSLQDVVYNHDKADNDADNYIVHYTPGYYRLHNQPGSEGISTPRFASGYLHDIEKTAGAGSTAIPLHFYSRTGVNTTFEGEGGLASGFTETDATRGAIPVPATEYDPSTIFYFSGSSGSINISTQGLNVVGNKMTASTGTTFTITDIGGGIVALSNSTDYLCYKQDGNIYDLKYGSYPYMESARWCMEPASKQGLAVTTNSGGDGYYYTTFCAPYDVAITDAVTNAYICTAWDTEMIHPEKVPASGTYAEGKFVPAATPVIIRTTDNTGKIQLTLPSTSPTSALSSCVFTGKYLEQLLPEISDNDKVYAFGLPITGYGLVTESGSTNGDITNVLDKNQADTGVGFYLNANPNKELSEETGLWTPNNRYVLHNKIYYRTGGSGVSSRQQTRTIDFVPVVFDDDEDGQPGEEDEAGAGGFPVGGGAYDLQGRCVATAGQVKDGTWRDGLKPGIYIVNGKKMSIGNNKQ